MTKASIGALKVGNGQPKHRMSNARLEELAKNRRMLGIGDQAGCKCDGPEDPQIATTAEATERRQQSETGLCTRACSMNMGKERDCDKTERHSCENFLIAPPNVRTWVRNQIVGERTGK